MARALGAEPGGRADHEADGLPGLGRPAAERRHLDVGADRPGRDPLAVLPRPQPLVGRRVPPPVDLGEDPRIPLDRRPARAGGRPPPALGVVDADRGVPDRGADDGRGLGPGADVVMEPGDLVEGELVDVLVVIAAVVEIQAADAELTVTLDPAVTLAGPGTFLGLTDTPAAYAPGALLRADAGAAAVELVAPTALRLAAAQLVSGRVPAARLGWHRYAVTTTDVVNTTAETHALAFQVGANEMGDGDLLRLGWLAVHRDAFHRTSSATCVMKLHWGASSMIMIERDLVSGVIARTEPGSENCAIHVWRRGETLYWSTSGTGQTAHALFDGTRPVHSLTPAFDRTQIVAISVTLSQADAQVYYRVYGVIAERLRPT